MHITMMFPSKHIIDILNSLRKKNARELTTEDFANPKVAKVLTKYARVYSLIELTKQIQVDNGKIANEFFQAAYTYTQ